MSALGPALAVLGAAPERLWGAMMKRMVANGDAQVRCAVFYGNKSLKKKKNHSAYGRAGPARPIHIILFHV